MLGESTRGRHIHSIAPEGATSATVSQSERNAYSAIGGNALAPVSGAYSRSRAGDDGADKGARRAWRSWMSASSRKVGSIEAYPQNANFGHPLSPRMTGLRRFCQPPSPPRSVNGFQGRCS